MKFCKNLQRVIEISDPAWAPYWTNYKMLKRLIKELPSVVPADGRAKSQSVSGMQSTGEGDRPESPSSVGSSKSSAAIRQQHGDLTAEITAVASNAPTTARSNFPRKVSVSFSNPLNSPVDKKESSLKSPKPEEISATSGKRQSRISKMGKSPGEVAFFKLLHAELKKTTNFFLMAQQEFAIREERVREGFLIMNRPNSIMVPEKWSHVAKSLYRLYKDLLLLETFAIMTYCSFSKILKKHDKVTGHSTRVPFMTNVVNKANFANYPEVLSMINRCEALYDDVSRHLASEGKECLCEDERLFINMIHRLNNQVMGTAEAEGAPDASERMKKDSTLSGPALNSYQPSPSSEESCKVTSSLRSLVEENALAPLPPAGSKDDADDAVECQPSDIAREVTNANDNAVLRDIAPKVSMKREMDDEETVERDQKRPRT